MHKGNSGYPARKPLYPGVSPIGGSSIATHHTRQKDVVAKRNGTAKRSDNHQSVNSNMFSHEEDKDEDAHYS